jgi:hypothetical protein
MKPIETVVDEIWRLLQPNGVLIALEPDYSAMVEHPPEIASVSIWTASLERSGARPRIGRERLQPPSHARFQLLRELPLTGVEMADLALIEKRSAELREWELIVHLPFFMVTAIRPG